MKQNWWERDDLRYENGRLCFGGRDVEAFGRAVGSPSYLYRPNHAIHNISAIKEALSRHGVAHQVFYAIKANRNPALLTHLLMSGLCGIDVCSPREMLRALQIGFHAGQISFTGTSVSDADLDLFARHPDLIVNADSLSVIRRFGERLPGKEIGLRINPQVGISKGDKIVYTGEKATKFGIYEDRFAEGIDLARSYQLRVNRLHFHAATGYLNPQLEQFEAILNRMGHFLDQLPGVRTLNIGGGLGHPLTEADQPLDLDRWAGIIANFAKPRHLEIHVEPGDYIMKPAGICLLEVNSVEEKGGTVFVGVNGGFQLVNHWVNYRMPNPIVPVLPRHDRDMVPVTIAGHINEGPDILGEGIYMHRPKEGDLLAVLNVGGYGSSMISDHCMRGEYAEYILL